MAISLPSTPGGELMVFGEERILPLHRMKDSKLAPGRQHLIDLKQTHVETHRSFSTCLSPQHALHDSYPGDDLIHQWARY